MDFIKYVKYSGLGIIAICSTAIAILAGAEFFELITWNEASKWMVKFCQLGGVGLALCIVWSIIGTIIAKDSKKTDKK